MGNSFRGINCNYCEKSTTECHKGNTHGKFRCKTLDSFEIAELWKPFRSTSRSGSAYDPNYKKIAWDHTDQCPADCRSSNVYTRARIPSWSVEIVSQLPAVLGVAGFSFSIFLEFSTSDHFYFRFL